MGFNFFKKKTEPYSFDDTKLSTQKELDENNFENEIKNDASDLDTSINTETSTEETSNLEKKNVEDYGETNTSPTRDDEYDENPVNDEYTSSSLKQRLQKKLNIGNEKSLDSSIENKKLELILTELKLLNSKFVKLEGEVSKISRVLELEITDETRKKLALDDLKKKF